MDERFHFIAPRAKRFLFYSARIHEILFDGSSNALVRLLAVPVQRRNLASVSEAVDTGSAESRGGCSTVKTATGGSIQQVGAGQVHHGYPRLHKLVKTKSDDAEGEADAKRGISISDFPIELQRKIFDNVGHIEDVICLGLTSRHFWALAQEYLDRYDASFVGQWAGKNIVCVGRDVEPGDYPPGLFSEAEMDEFRTRTIKKADDNVYLPPLLLPGLDPSSFHSVARLTSLPPNFYSPGLAPTVEVRPPVTVPFTLHHFALPTVSVSETSPQRQELESVVAYSRCRGRDPQDPAFELTRKAMHARSSAAFPEDEPWILRNLTTKEFVRSEAIALKPEFIRGPNIEALGFGEVLLARICWSSTPSPSFPTTNICRGVWAGHRFDITTASSHRCETKGVEWKDVSEEAVGDVANVWSCLMGSGWREQICEMHDNPAIRAFRSRSGQGSQAEDPFTILFSNPARY
ncbi:f-box domain containing [Trichoderma arundinaceum]|uniref:F-box domain containing n=1 Tax=Trichoderma arundinaceum TaxID=490622 RepID=A0A395NFC4_TRIAR|nr:f-box domain containing [Trichoderma arundinaceum]